MKLMETIYKAANEPLHTAALDMVFDEIDELLMQNKFGAVDFALQNIRIDGLRTSILLSMVVVTKQAQNKLPNRIGFIRRVKKELERRGENIGELYCGLDTAKSV